MDFSESRYLELLEELFKQSPAVQNIGFTSDSYKPGLEGMRALDVACGRPSGRLKCIHVAGTNGKGSVCSMLAASLAGSGLKAGLYTSPHLLDFRERMKICSGPSFRLVSKEDVWSFLNDYSEAIKGRSFFEVTTAMALWWFDKEGVDIAVIETGLGGRLDSTNIITPELSVITSIGLDHCALLGSTRARIASEKAGIFKPGTPALIWSADEETFPVFKEKAFNVGAPLFVADELIRDDDVNGWTLDLEAGCQKTNLKTVMAALSLYGIDADKEAIEKTVSLTGLHGRWEKLSDNPEVICDIGHNPEALAHNFEKIKASGKRPVLVYGVMADKDYKSILKLIPEGFTIIPCAPKTPRSLQYKELTYAIHESRPDLYLKETDGSVAGAVKTAIELCTSGDIIYIGGSTFVVAEALPLFKS